MKMIGRNNDKVEFIEVRRAQAKLTAATVLGLTTKYHSRAGLALRQNRQKLCLPVLHMLNILRSIPVTGPRHGTIPQMIGNALRLQPLPHCTVINGLYGLIRIPAAR